MGVVYRAVDSRSGHVAALKTVALHDERLLAGIRGEIRALQRLRHPGIVEIVDYGVCDGLPWYAMQWLQGSTLDAFEERGQDTPQTVSALQAPSGRQDHTPSSAPTLDAGRSMGVANPDGAAPPEPFASPRAPRASSPLRRRARVSSLSIARDLCSSLAYLHGEGIVHRDLKPRNIIVQPGNRPVLVDFGLYQSWGAADSREELAIEMLAAGTVPYIAPEQIRGELVDARADLYSLGCILYELLTGRVAFLGSEPEIINKHLTARPLPPSALARGVPPVLDELVPGLLAKDRRDRIGYADTVGVELAKLGATVHPEFAGPPRQAYLYRARFFGRGPELRRLSREVDNVLEGRRAMILLGGESGIGKTRLMVEASRLAAGRGMMVVASRCLERVSEALEALRPLLRRLDAYCRGGGPAVTRSVLGDHRRVLAAYEPSLSISNLADWQLTA